ncbi:hypothetical protein [Leucobacter soli]|uniref:hypothetical protein n=1 Tax=Leucobacter soli TaxID=2812850 RepID=UPI00361C8107
MTEPATDAPPSGAPAYRRRSRSAGRILIVVGIVVVAAVIAVLALVLNQGDGDRSQPSGGGAPAAGPSELTIGLQLEPTNLDIRSTGGVALDQILIDNIYQGLVGLAPARCRTSCPCSPRRCPPSPTTA